MQRMNNNLKWLITKADLSFTEFGIKIFPEMPIENEKDKAVIRAKVRRLCADNVRFPIEKLETISEVLKCDYNQLFNYNKTN